MRFLFLFTLAIFSFASARATETSLRVEAGLVGDEVSSGQWFKGSTDDECVRAEKLLLLFTVGTQLMVTAECTIQKYSRSFGIEVVPTNTGGIDGRVILPEHGSVAFLDVVVKLPKARTGVQLTFKRADSAEYAEKLWNRIAERSKMHRILVTLKEKTVHVYFSPK